MIEGFPSLMIIVKILWKYSIAVYTYLTILYLCFIVTFLSCRPDNDAGGETETTAPQAADSTTQLMADVQNVIEASGVGENLGGKPSARSQASSLKSPEPVDNPAADLRNMRRIIAEDKEWSLMTVPLLWELCISHIVANFESE